MALPTTLRTLNWAYLGRPFCDTAAGQLSFDDIDLSKLDIDRVGLPFAANSQGPTYFGILKRWTGAIWLKEPLYVYLSGAWNTGKLMRRWTGSKWGTIDTTGV